MHITEDIVTVDDYATPESRKRQGSNELRGGRCKC